MKPLIYLGSPYTHADNKIRKKRAEIVSKAAMYFIENGVMVYCPIAESIELAKHSTFTNTTWEFWREKDLTILNLCKELYICSIDGWKDSIGLRAEIKYAIKNDIKISLVVLNETTQEVEAIMKLSRKDVLALLNLEDENQLND